MSKARPPEAHGFGSHVPITNAQLGRRSNRQASSRMAFYAFLRNDCLSAEGLHSSWSQLLQVGVNQPL